VVPMAATTTLFFVADLRADEECNPLVGDTAIDGWQTGRRGRSI
jgi:hypothetical protein